MLINTSVAFSQVVSSLGTCSNNLLQDSHPPAMDSSPPPSSPMTPSLVALGECMVWMQTVRVT